MTKVLVHGGGFGANSWDLLVPHLEGPVIAVDLPGRGSRPADVVPLTTADFVEAVVADIESADVVDAVLVGHSLAGITLPAVAARIPERIARLVFVSCTVPADGATVFDTLDPGIQDLARGNAEAKPETLSVEMVTAMFGNGMSPEQLAFTMGHLVPEAPGVIFEPVRLAGLANAIPRTWVRLLRDQIVPVDKQDRFIANIGGAEVVDLDAGHMAMITDVDALADILNRA